MHTYKQYAALLGCDTIETDVTLLPYTLTKRQLTTGCALDLSLDADAVIGADLVIELPVEVIDTYTGLELASSWCFSDGLVSSEVSTSQTEGHITIQVHRLDCSGQTGDGLFLTMLFSCVDTDLDEEAESLSGVIIMIDDFS